MQLPWHGYDTHHTIHARSTPAILSGTIMIGARRLKRRWIRYRSDLCWIIFRPVFSQLARANSKAAEVQTFAYMRTIPDKSSPTRICPDAPRVQR